MIVSHNHLTIIFLFRQTNCSLMLMESNKRIKLTPNGQIFTINPSHGPRSKRRNDLRFQGQKIKLQFRHTFQEYLKMALCKIIPQQGVLIDPEQGCIYGLKDMCIAFKKKVQKEFSTNQFKKVELRKEYDLDALQYQLDSEFQARIYRPRFIQMALKTLSRYSCFEASSNTFAKILKNKIVIIVRVKAEFSHKCMKNLEEILRGNSEGQKLKQKPVPIKSTPYQPANTSMDQESYEQVQMEQEQNYYKIKFSQSQKQDHLVQESKSSFSITDSSFSLTKTDSSLFIEDEQDELNNSTLPPKLSQHSFC